jgi:hypothetical protein
MVVLMCGVSAVNGPRDGSSKGDSPIGRSKREFDVRALEDAVTPRPLLTMALVAAGSGQAVQREHADDGSLLVPSTTRALQAPRRTVRGAALGFDYREIKRILSR